MSNTTIATKIPVEVKEAMEKMAASRGLTMYELMQNAIMSILRLGNEKIMMSPLIKEKWCQFENIWGSHSIANVFTFKKSDIEIVDAIYRVRQTGRSECSLMLVRRPFFDEPSMSINSNEIFDAVMRTAFPSTAKMLEKIRKDNDLPNIASSVSWLINQYNDELIENEISEMFSDNDRHENGRKMPTVEMKRRNRITMARYEQGQTLHEDDFFGKMAEAGSEDEDGGKVEVQ